MMFLKPQKASSPRTLYSLTADTYPIVARRNLLRPHGVMNMVYCWHSSSSITPSKLIRCWTLKYVEECDRKAAMARDYVSLLWCSRPSIVTTQKWYWSINTASCFKNMGSSWRHHKRGGKQGLSSETSKRQRPVAKSTFLAPVRHMCWHDPNGLDRIGLCDSMIYVLKEEMSWYTSPFQSSCTMHTLG